VGLHMNGGTEAGWPCCRSYEEGAHV